MQHHVLVTGTAPAAAWSASHTSSEDTEEQGKGGAIQRGGEHNCSILWTENEETEERRVLIQSGSPCFIDVCSIIPPSHAQTRTNTVHTSQSAVTTHPSVWRQREALETTHRQDSDTTTYHPGVFPRQDEEGTSRQSSSSHSASAQC